VKIVKNTFHLLDKQVVIGSSRFFYLRSKDDPILDVIKFFNRYFCLVNPDNKSGDTIPV